MARRILYARLLVVVALWGTTFSVSRILLDKIDVFALIALRMVFGLGALLLYLGLRRKTGEIIPMYRANRRAMLFIGTVAFALAYVVQYIALPLTTTFNQAILLNFQAFFVVLINFVHFKRKATYFFLVGAVTAFAGAVLINFRGDLVYSLDYIWGDLLTVLCTFFWGMFTALSKPVCEREGNDPIVFNAIIMFVAACTLLPFGALSPTGFAMLGSLNAWDWLGVIWLGAGCVAVPYVLWFSALKEIESEKVAVFVYMEPIFAGILGVLFLGEVITLFSLLGMLLCFLGVSLAQLKPRDGPARALPVPA